MKGDGAAALAAAPSGPSGERLAQRISDAVLTTRTAHAVNIGLITALALFCAFLINQENSFWALFTVALVAQPTSGTTVWRSFTRVLGTLIGGAYGLLVLAFFAQNAVAVVAAMALWIFCIGFLARFQLGLDAYAYAVSGLTALVVILDTGPDVALAYPLALARITETLIGVGATFVVILVLFPSSTSKMLLAGIRDTRTQVIDLAKRAFSPDRELDVADAQGVAKALAGTYANLRAQALERSHGGLSVAKVTMATNLLNRLLVEAERMSFALAGLSKTDPPPAVSQANRRLLALMESAPRKEDGPEALRDHAKALRAAVVDIDLRPLIDGLTPEPDRPSSRELVALDAMRRFAAASASYLEAEAAIDDPAAPEPKPRRIAPRYGDWRAAIERGLRPAIVCIVLMGVWIATASAPFRTLALIGTAMALNLPAIAPRATLLKAGKLQGLGMASMFLPVLALEIALPYVESFAIYALLVGSVMAVYFYIGYAPAKRIYALGGAIFLVIALQPANAQTYSATALFNAAAALAFMPLALAVAFGVIFPENQRWLANRLTSSATDLLKRAARGRDDHPHQFLAQSLDAIGDYGGDLDLTDETHRRHLRRSCASLAAGLELYDLHALRRSNHLSPMLADRLAPIGDAVVAAAAGRDGMAPARDPRGTLAEARTQAFTEAKREGVPELTKAGALRFALGLEFLEMLVEDRRLTLERAN